MLTLTLSLLKSGDNIPSTRMFEHNRPVTEAILPELVHFLTNGTHSPQLYSTRSNQRQTCRARGLTRVFALYFLFHLQFVKLKTKRDFQYVRVHQEKLGAIILQLFVCYFLFAKRKFVCFAKLLGKHRRASVRFLFREAKKSSESNNPTADRQEVMS